MGQTPSTPLPSALPSYALHCLRVADSSPSAGLLEPFFDYLIGVDTPVPLPPVAGGPGSFDGEDGELGLTPLDLGRILDRCEGQEIGLRVYNAKSQRVRDVRLTPSRAWAEAAIRQERQAQQNGQSSSEAEEEDDRKPSLLGLSLRVCNPAHALESVYHVLDVLEGSPAEMAGLVPWGDFVLAWSGGPLHSEQDFYKLIEAHMDRPLRLFVYNSDLDNLREVILYPTRQWGGEGLIGCGIGYGLLHRIPRPSTPPTLFTAPDGYFASSTAPRSSVSNPAGASVNVTSPSPTIGTHGAGSVGSAQELPPGVYRTRTPSPTPASEAIAR